MKSRREYQELKFMNSLNENKEKAKAYLNDDEKMEKLFRDFEDKLKLIPKIGNRASDIAVLLSLVRAYIKKQYTDVSPSTIMLAVAGLIYVVTPVDLIPDYILGLGADDVAVLAHLVGGGVIFEGVALDGHLGCLALHFHLAEPLHLFAQPYRLQAQVGIAHSDAHHLLLHTH